jgi:predicted short-subunit dehydrogenase-like oxidoreductase (DUF2520 family)
LAKEKPKENQKAGRKPSISIIGAGRLGGALALALAERGYVVEALMARRLSRARRVGNLLERRAIALSEKQLNLLPSSALIIIATPDDLIDSIAHKLADTQNGMPGQRTVLHTSGALSSKVLSPLAGAGFRTGSLHPLLSVSEPAAGAAKLRDAFFCLEGNRSAVRIARQLVRDLGGHSFSIAPGNKALYHAAAVMASGHLIALFDIAIEMLAHCGLSERRAREVLLPLVASTVANLSVKEPAGALTGTFARGDVATVERHLTAIEKESLPEALSAYVLLGRRSLSLARQGSPRAVEADQIFRILERFVAENDTQASDPRTHTK